MSTAVGRLERRERIARTESRLQAVRSAAWHVAGLARIQQVAVLAGMVGMIGAVGSIETA